ncbi:MAG: class A beta-lactamase-related serine hydrolase [Oligoflexia bacterium]|nr:class A beta-lactamase-related serine hydrolase [Oligoflexia bacterium]
MNAFSFFSILFLCPAIVLAQFSDPSSDPNFLKLSDGRDLKSIKVSGSKLSLSVGSGKSFGTSQQEAYQKLKSESKSMIGYPVQWTLRDLSSGALIDESLESNRKQFGASVSKVFVGAALVDKKQGELSASQLQLFCNMLVVSSNTAWVDLQRQIGEGNSDRGREYIQGFTQRMGYLRTRGFQGYWGDIHGNELTPKELGDFLVDTYNERYPGAEILWKVMHTSRTGSSRAKKYLPANLYVGGKTGTYSGETVDPETGSPRNPDGSPYRVNVRHQVIVFFLNGRQYGLSILADTGSDESAAVLAGGIYRDLVAGNSL